MWIAASLLLLAAAGLIGLKSLDCGPSAEAEEALQASGVEIEQAGSYIAFAPAGDPRSPSVLLYPGALVDERSYAPLALELSRQGYPVYLIRMPLDLAVLGGSRADEVLDSAPDGSFVIGGHSLGGVMAARYAAEHPDRLKGVFFLASYPDSKGDLNGTGLKALSVFATNDQVMDRGDWGKAKRWLPPDTAYVPIEGGNHAGFGAYGAQRGDGKSSLPAGRQTLQTAQAMAEWLESLP
ncbi:alpha/beta fold hydrolase [Paenibacillus albicereus]|uniref:Alpha/beta fold hydrolase n=2 Tax=Paenibacillus albicereus TaxID=2726185 RepID=A0A6H2H440_9BACL|nr:alpha/beta fold hydrolase [Paenibacillus albicereus]